MRSAARWTLIVMVILVNIGCDQVTKSIVRDKINYHEKINVVGNMVYLTKVENTGGMLSLGHNLPETSRLMVLTYIPGIILIFGILFLFFHKKTTREALIGYCFIIGGGMGNLIDRHFYGSVTDFMNIGIGSVRTGIFNMADVSIMAGLGLLLMTSNFTGYRKTAEK